MFTRFDEDPEHEVPYLQASRLIDVFILTTLALWNLSTISDISVSCW